MILGKRIIRKKKLYINLKYYLNIHGYDEYNNVFRLFEMAHYSLKWPLDVVK
jgi:hypothetical protein